MCEPNAADTQGVFIKSTLLLSMGISLTPLKHFP